MENLTQETIRDIARKAAELYRQDELPPHRLIWVVERIAGVGDGHVPAAIQSIIDSQ